MAIKLWRQYAMGIAVTYNIFIMGVASGWTSPSQVKLQNAEMSPLGYALTDDEFASVNSVFMPAALFGPVVCGLLVSVISCRHVLLTALSIQLVGTILITLSLNLLTLVIGRIILGFGTSMSCSCVMILIEEITTVEARGVVSTFISLFLSLGILFGYSLGSFSSYFVLNSVTVCIIAVHIVVMYLLPESPVYLMKKGDHEGAIKVLTQLRGRKVIQIDLEFLKPKTEETKTRWINRRVFTDKANLKSILLGSALIGCQTMAGNIVLMAYMNYIFEAAGSKLMPAVSSIIVAACAVAATIASSLVVGTIRRKVLLIPAYIIAMINTATLGVYFKLDTDGWDVRSTMGYLPLVTIILFTLAINFGISPVTYATIGELTTPETKTAISTFSVTIALLLGFLLLRLFSVMINSIGAHGMFFMSSSSSLLLLLVVIFVLPETKGKTAEQLRKQLM